MRDRCGSPRRRRRPSRSGAVASPSTSVERKTLVERQAEAKRCAAPRGVFVFQNSAVRLDDQLAETEPDAAAAGFGAVAEIEYRGQPLRRDSGAGVLETQNNLFAVAASADFDRAA